MSTENEIQFNFTKVINELDTYDLLFPTRETGLAIIYLYEKIENGSFHEGKFLEKDLHEAFQRAHKTKERYPKAKYDAGIVRLQEYFLDYNQETQKYFFKDYAYKFCRHAKETLHGAFNPTRIEQICNDLSQSLKTIETIDELRFWLENRFKKYEPDFREQVDFLDRQIVHSVEQLKRDASFSGNGFISILMAISDNLEKAQTHAKELRSAYAETKSIQSILEKWDVDDIEIIKLISGIYLFIRYINERLSSIDRKLDRIQPKIRQLFSTLNKPMFSTKVEKFLNHLLNNSTVSFTEKAITLPSPILPFQIYQNTPDFTIIHKDRQLFPPRPKPRAIYAQNPEIIKRNTERVEKRIHEQDTVQKWEESIISELNLRGIVDLSAFFFQIIKEGNESQIAVSVIFNVIKTSYGNDGLVLEINTEIQADPEVQNISIWKMVIRKK